MITIKTVYTGFMLYLLVIYMTYGLTVPAMWVLIAMVSINRVTKGKY